MCVCTSPTVCSFSYTIYFFSFSLFSFNLSSLTLILCILSCFSFLPLSLSTFYQEENLRSDRATKPSASHCQPTRANILSGIRWLTKDAQPGDSLFLHYSGHGGQVKSFLCCYCAEMRCVESQTHTHTCTFKCSVLSWHYPFDEI